MGQETELKLHLPAFEISSLRSHPFLKTPPQKTILDNTYYDTPELELLELRIGLRFRQQGKVSLLTVKTAGQGHAGLSQRGEWEYPATPGTFDFSPIDDISLRNWLEERRHRFVPVFSTRFTRWNWKVFLPENAPNYLVDIALDRGSVTSGEHHERLCELELELLPLPPQHAALDAGTVANPDAPEPNEQESKLEDASALFGLALSLQEAAPGLHPENTSKAERGYRLFLKTPASPIKFLPAIQLTNPGAVEHFMSQAFACLNHLQGNERGLFQSTDPEFVHQSRVAIRRLVALMRFYNPALEKEFVSTYYLRWTMLAKQLGRIRNLDLLMDLVQASQPWQANQHALLPNRGLAHRLSRLRHQQIKTLKNTFDSSEYSRLILTFSADLIRLALKEKKADTQNQPTDIVMEVVQPRLKRRHRRILKQLKRLREKLRAEEAPSSSVISKLHELRLDVKQMRYSMESLPKASDVSSEKKRHRYAADLTRLQEVLGDINDRTSARQLLGSQELSSGHVIDRAFIDGWLAGSVQGKLSALPSLMKKFKRQFQALTWN